LLINLNLRASLTLGLEKGDTAMSELIPMTELTDTELDAVCGGILDFGNVVPQNNSATNSAVTVLGVSGLTAQAIGQQNVSLIGSAAGFII
jgi:hypothetical protein